MDDHRREAPGESPDPIPRDLPDQQARDGEDPWEVPVGPTRDASESESRVSWAVLVSPLRS